MANAFLLLPALLMRHSIFILTLLISETLFGQVKFGTYTQLDTSEYADLKLFPNKKFEFYDTRNGSCFLWTHYKGNWKIIKDTVVFYWRYEQTETPDTVIKQVNPLSSNINLTFLYNDGQPIQNAEACYACDFLMNCKKHLSDRNGKIVISKSEVRNASNGICTNNQRRLYYTIKSNYIDFSSNSVQDTSTNSLTIVIKKKRTSKIVTDTKKYSIMNDRLTDIDYKENSLLNWGDLKYYSKKYGR